MPPGMWFWIIYVIIVIMGLGWGFANNWDRRGLGGSFVLFMLIGLLGWGIFGPPIR